MSCIQRFGLSILVLILVAQPGPTGADELSLGPPLLQFHGNGVETTSLNLPFCGVACDNLFPTFVSHQMTLGTDGFVTWTTVRNPLGDDRRGGSVLVAGEGRPELLRALRQSLAEARIGFSEGGCSVVDFETFVAEEGVDGIRFLPLDAQLTWYGRGDRYRVVELPAEADPCPEPLQRIVRLLLDLRSQAAGS